MTEKEIRDYLAQQQDQARRLREYAKEKQEIKGFVSDERPDIIAPFERRKLRAHAIQLAYERDYNAANTQALLDESETIFQWIIKPE